MRLVVDANILFAALITDGLTASILVREDLELFTPAYALDEFAKYHTLILAKTRRGEREFDEFFEIVSRRVEVVPRTTFEKFLPRARRCSPDLGDAPYFALAVHLDATLWTEDKALREQDVVTTVTTAELATREMPQPGNVASQKRKRV